MADIVFLSPHLDDAILSCGLRIRLHVALGDNVTIATVFSEGEGYKARQEEDRRACAAIGARHLHFGFLDAPDRNPRYADFIEIVFGPADEKDRDTVAAISTVLSHIKADMIYAPLAAGSHIDHRLVCAAASPLRPGFYEDRPYSLWPGVLQARLNALRIKHELPVVSPAEMTGAMSGFTFLKAFVPEGIVREAMLTRYLDGLSLPVVPLMDAEEDVVSGSRNDAEAVWKALSHYESQLPQIYRDQEDFIAACSKDGQFFERVWRLR